MRAEPAARPRHAASRPWRETIATPRYRRTWSLCTLPHLGYWIVIFTFQAILAEKTGADPLVLGLFYFITLVPFLLLSLHAGVWADRFDRAHLLAVAHLLILVVSGTVAVLILTQHTTVPTFMVSGFVFGIAMAVSQPAGQSLIAESVPVGLMATAVTVQGFGVTLSRFVGPAVAALTISVVGTGVTMLAHCILSLTTALLALSLRAPRSPASENVAPLGPAAIRSGLTHARARWPVTTSLSAVAVVSLFGASYLSQLAALAALATTSRDWFAVLMSATGLGALGGVVLAALPLPPSWEVRRLCSSMLLLGLCLVALGHVRSQTLQLVLVVGAAAFQFTTITGSVRLIQKSIANSHRGRVMSLYQLCYAGLIPLGGLMLGTIWSWAGPDIAFSALGVIVACSAAVMIARFWSLDPQVPLERRRT